jgi:nickel/cobalt exporter
VDKALFSSVAATGFAVAFLHAAIPTHWLPFVLVSRGQHWSVPKTLSITVLAGFSHALMTMALGALIMGAGLALAPVLGKVFPLVVGGVLIAVGLFYLLRQALGTKGGHVHAEGRAFGSDRAAIIGLVTLLALSPCEAFLPIYLANVRHGWLGFAGLSLVLAVATSAGMLLFTALSLAGAQKLKLEALARYERAILGGALCLLGVAVILIEH